MLTMHLKPKSAKRIPIIRPPEEVWEFFRKHNLNIIRNGNDFRIMTIDKDPLEPLKLFRKLAVPILIQKKNNFGKYLGVKPAGSQWLSEITGEHKYKSIYGPYDMQLDATLKAQLQEIEDYWYSWKKLLEKIIYDIEKIPKDLLFKRNRNTEERTIKRQVSKDQDIPSLNQWTGSRKDFASFVKGKFKHDQINEPENRLYEDLKDASEKLYTQYKFPKTWNWTTDKCYKYVLKVT